MIVSYHVFILKLQVRAVFKEFSQAYLPLDDFDLTQLMHVLSEYCNGD